MGAVQALADVTMKALQREVPQLDNLTRLMLTAFDFGAFLTSQHGLVQAFNRHSQPGQGVTLAKAMPLEEGMTSPEDQGEDAGTLLHESQFDLATFYELPRSVQSELLQDLRAKRHQLRRHPQQCCQQQNHEQLRREQQEQQHISVHVARKRCETSKDALSIVHWLTAGSSARHQRKRRCAESSIIPVIDVEA